MLQAGLFEITLPFVCVCVCVCVSFFSARVKQTLKTIVSNAGEGVKKRELSYTVGVNVNWYHHYGEQYEGSLKI